MYTAVYAFLVHSTQADPAVSAILHLRTLPLLQWLPEFHKQGKHYAWGRHQDVAAEPEKHALAELYQSKLEGCSVAELANEVCFPFSFMARTKS